MEAEQIVVETNLWCDIYVGPLDALLAAGVVERSQLPPQPGRQKHYAMFMPDGSAVPEHGAGGTMYMLPGFKVVRDLTGDRYRVQVSVPAAEHARRYAAKDAEVRIPDEHFQSYVGTAEQLRRAGVPEHWFAGLPLPGKSRGHRKFAEASAGLKS